jgi:lipooligosaccharide transport system ATP-binding protein
MDEASKLADRLQVLQAGKVRAMGSPKHVLGDIVGEHVIVLPVDDPHAERATTWCKARGMQPSQILGQWHIAAKGGDLAAFVASFPDAQCEVRQPTLDDLFVSLAGEERKEVVA